MPRSHRVRAFVVRAGAATLEALESRELLSGASAHRVGLPHPPVHVSSLHAGHATRFGHPEQVVKGTGATATSLRAHPLAQPVAGSFASPTPSPGSLTPLQVRSAYEFDATNQGQGQTIAIVDAYDAPNIASDVNTFSTTFGLPTMNTAGGPTFTKATPQGKPRANGGWAQEISLDVEWVHAIAPKANILLVEAKSNAYTDLFGAVQYAASQGATVVSMSFGGSEFSGETSYDSTFTHSGVTYVASAGDSGVKEYPALSPNILAVGGTTLNLVKNADGTATWSSESVWNNSSGSTGGGVSTYEGVPSYQAGLGKTGRSNPDIALVADPYTGVAVYDSYSYQGQTGWLQFGGTSASAPMWAALVGIADQERAASGKGSLGGSQVLGAVYASLTSGTSGSEDLHDITSGGTSSGNAGPGYDLATGRGTPHASRVIGKLVTL